MCGILAVLSKTKKLDINRCENALSKISQRGPDFNTSSLVYEDRLYLGQTVLSITGSKKSNDTSYIYSSSGRYQIIFNGEVYNYRRIINDLKIPFINHSNSDTELLVNAHEIESPDKIFDRLNGMFAYVVYDSSDNSLLIGRDIIGEKVLYIYDTPNILILSSEIAPILELETSIGINKDHLREYFYTRHLLTSAETVFHDVRLFPPGSLMRYDIKSNKLNTLKLKKLSDFIDPKQINENKRRNDEDLLDELEEIFINNSKNLIPQEVPYFSVFSGGVDSSLASHFLKMEKDPQEFITLQFPGKDFVSNDMSIFSDKVGKQIISLPVYVDDYADKLISCYSHSCSPLPTHSFVSQALLSQYVNDSDCKVLIGGDGADELFGGYEFYKTISSNFFSDSNPSPYSGFVNNQITFSNWTTDKLREKMKSNWLEANNNYGFEEDQYERLMQAVLYSDTTIQLESVGIRAADTMSMMHSVESRSFFLGQEVMRFALNLPLSHKVDLSLNGLEITKPLLKKLFIRCFGHELLMPKQGFSGYPNEAGRALLASMGSNGFPLTMEYLKLNLNNHVIDRDYALEWKMINVELFLNVFADRM